MKIKFNRDIQNLVEKIEGSELAGVADLHVMGQTLTDDFIDAAETFTNGFDFALRLLHKFQVKFKRQRVPNKAFGVYSGEREERGFDVDTFYFIGTPEQIIAKLKKLPQEEQEEHHYHGRKHCRR